MGKKETAKQTIYRLTELLGCGKGMLEAHDQLIDTQGEVRQWLFLIRFKNQAALYQATFGLMPNPIVQRMLRNLRPTNSTKDMFYKDWLDANFPGQWEVYINTNQVFPSLVQLWEYTIHTLNIMKQANHADTNRRSV